MVIETLGLILGAVVRLVAVSVLLLASVIVAVLMAVALYSLVRGVCDAVRSRERG